MADGHGVPPPPWTCRLRAVVRVGIGRGHLTALAVVAYSSTPVGPYAEALLAQVRPAHRVTVPWIVVDSAASVVGGRSGWGLPKELTSLAVELDAAGGTAQVTVPGRDDLQVRARARGPRVPVVLAAVLEQPGRGRAALRFRGRARPALVRVRGGPAPGTGPGAVLHGELHLAAPSP